jgi:hypothetical protein
MIFDIDINEFKEVKNKIIIYVEMLKKYFHSEKNILKILNHMENSFIKLKFHEILAN